MGDPDTGPAWRMRNAQKVPTRRDDRAGTRRNSQKDNIFDEQTRIRRDSSIVERPRDRGNVLSVAKRRGD